MCELFTENKKKAGLHIFSNKTGMCKLCDDVNYANTKVYIHSEKIRNRATSFFCLECYSVLP